MVEPVVGAQQSLLKRIAWNDYFIALLFLLFVAAYTLLGPGMCYRPTSYKALSGTLAIDLLAIVYFAKILYLGPGNTRFPLVLPLFIAYVLTAIFPTLVTGLGYDTHWYFGRYLGYFVLILVIADLIDKKRLRLFLILLTIFNFGISTYCLLAYFAIITDQGAMAPGQVIMFTFGNQNYFANYLVMMIPLALSLTSLQTNIAFRIGGFVTAALLYGCCVLTYSRNAFGLGLFMFLLFVLLIFYAFGKGLFRGMSSKIWIISTGVVLITIITVMIINTKPLIQKLLLSVTFQGLLGTRFLAIKTAWDLFLDNWFSILFGHGLGSFYQLVFSHYSPDFLLYDAERSFKHVHNDFLEHLCEGGLINFALFFAIIGFTLYFLAKNLRRSDRLPDEKILSIALLCSIVGYASFAVFDIATRIISSQFTYYLVIGLAWVLIDRRIYSISRALVFPIVVAAMIGSSVFATSYFMSDYYHRQANNYNYKNLLQREKLILQQLMSQLDPQLQNTLRLQKEHIGKSLIAMDSFYYKALAWNKNNIYVHYDQMLFYFRHNQFNELDQKRIIIDNLIPHYRNCDEVTALSFVRRGDSLHALSYLEAYLGRDSYNFTVQAGLIVLLLKLEQKEKAIANLVDLVLKQIKFAEYKYLSVGKPCPFLYRIDRHDDIPVLTITASDLSQEYGVANLLDILTPLGPKITGYSTPSSQILNNINELLYHKLNIAR